MSQIIRRLLGVSFLIVAFMGSSVQAQPSEGSSDDYPVMIQSDLKRTTFDPDDHEQWNQNIERLRCFKIDAKIEKIFNYNKTCAGMGSSFKNKNRDLYSIFKWLDHVRMARHKNLLTQAHIETLNELKISAEGNRYVKFKQEPVREEKIDKKSFEPQEESPSTMLQSVNVENFFFLDTSHNAGF